MKKGRIAGVLALMLLCAICAFAMLGCKDDSEDTYTVTFAADGEVVATRTYSDKNKNVVEPNVPLKQHYTGEWEKYELNGTSFIVKAKYTPIDYTVTFKFGDETIEELTYNVESTRITEPQLPQAEERAHYTFGWEEYELNGGNKTVRAKYTPVEYTVTFKNGIDVVDIRSYNVENKQISEPLVPYKAGYTGEWEKYELNCTNITVQAIYEIEDNDYYFEKSSKGQYYIIKAYNGVDKQIELPSTYQGLPVKEIAAEAFKNEVTLKSVSI